MLEARSVAVVGASARPESPGYQAVRQLIVGGFEGAIAPVNPKYDEIQGHRCFASLEEIPYEIDLAILGVPNRSLVDQLQRAAALSIPAAVIFASGLEGDPSDTRLLDELKRVALEGDMAICGGNCMGFVNFEHGLRALAFEEEEGLQAGPITWISHSGSAFTALLHNDRSLRFNLAVSAGQELTVSVADYMRYAIDRESTGVIALFVEAIRDPDGFRAALAVAADKDVPVVILKVGRVARAQTLVRAHSGALAGEDAVYDALFEAYGAMRVSSFNEMADLLELLSAGRRAPAGGLAAIHDSGGERAHFVDAAADVGVTFSELGEGTRQRIESAIEPGLPIVNPLDAWGTGNDFDKIFLECTRALLEDPQTAALAFAVDLSREDPEWGYAPVAQQAFSETEKPMAVVSNLDAAIDREAALSLRRAGVPVLQDTFSGLKAFRHLLAFRDRRLLMHRAPIKQAPESVRARWTERLAAPGPWDEVAALALLGDYDIPVVPSRRAATLDEAAGAARDFAYPIALKTTGRDHKIDAGGVVLNIEDEAGLTVAYREMSERLGPDVVVQPMARPGIEMALGLVRDPQFGPVVVVAAGGVLVELLDDKQLGLPPVDEKHARAMLDRLKARPLLEGARGTPGADIDSLARAVSRLSALAADLGDHIEALDVNPILVGADGCVAVDALVVPRA